MPQGFPCDGELGVFPNLTSEHTNVDLCRKPTRRCAAVVPRLGRFGKCLALPCPKKSQDFRYLLKLSMLPNYTEPFIGAEVTPSMWLDRF